MDDVVTELAERGRDLAPADRRRLVDLLLASLDDASLEDVQAAWDAEAERRLAAHRRSEVQASDGEEVLARARRLARR